jgi:DNA-binding beta-propeller fold protein YncE
VTQASTPGVGAIVGDPISLLLPATQVKFSPVNPQQPNAGQVYALWTELIGHSVTYGLLVVDLRSAQVLRNVRFTEEPVDCAVTPDGRYVYIAAASDLLQIQTDTFELATIPLAVPSGAIAGSTASFPLQLLTAVALTPDGSKLLVAGQQTQPHDAEQNGYLALLDPSSHAVLKALTSSAGTDFQTHHIVVTPDNRYALVNLADQRIDVVDLQTFTIVASVGVAPSWVMSMAVDAGGTYAFVATGTPGATSGSIQVVEVANWTVVGTFPITSGGPQQVAVSADGKSLYVAANTPPTTSLLLLDSHRGDPVTSITNAGPFALDPGRQRIYIVDAVAKALDVYHLSS